ncbi:MAG: hypothetical protein ACI9CB_002436 [Rhodothermales bacterium]|jgi:hypothetical protein
MVGESIGFHVFYKQVSVMITFIISTSLEISVRMQK